MAMRKARWLGSRRAAIALSIAVVATLMPLAARAQFFGTWDDRPRRQQGGGGFFSFPFFDRPYNPQQQYGTQPPGYGQPRPEESSKAPPPRKVEAPPTTTIVVIGDSFADWLAYGLEEIYTDQPQLGIERRIRPNSGLIHYEPRNDMLEWSQAVKDILATEKPAAVVVMLGLNDRVPLKVQAGGAKPEGKQPGAGTAAQGKPEGKQPAPGVNASAPAAQAAQPQQGQDAKTAAQPAPAAAAQPSEEQSAAAEPQRPALPGTYEFHTDEWADLYGKRIDDMIAVLKAKGVPVIWVGLPAVRGPRATSEMSYLDDLYHARADKAGIVYVDVWDGFVDENGRYAVQGPDFEGQTRRLRSGDGVHFSKAGAEKLAHYVEHELARVMANPVVPVALPSPEATAPAAAASGAVRPAIGPVLPLAVTGTGEGGDLLGAGSRPSAASPDPTAASVLVRGEALAAPAGRADNFAWPRSSAGASAKPAQKATPASTAAPASSASAPPQAAAPAPAPTPGAPVPVQAATPAPSGTPAAQ
jgi:uncharacterized protein